MTKDDHNPGSIEALRKDIDKLQAAMDRLTDIVAMQAETSAWSTSNMADVVQAVDDLTKVVSSLHGVPS